MNAVSTTLLGAIAGSTIFIGLPIARIERLSARVRAFLATFSAGILLFLFWDVVTVASGTVETALNGAKDGTGSWARFAGLATMLIVGFAAGPFALARVERAVLRRRPLAPVAGGAAMSATAAGLDADALAAQARRAALTLGMLIATAIGVHNFAEGLAIGVAARSGEVALAGTLIVGFALHNATEGFGIVGPLGGQRPTWRWLGLAGLIGGGPTFLGTLLGYRITSEPLQLAFLAVAGGAIVYVVGEIWGSSLRRASKDLVLSGLVAGFVAGLATDWILIYAGA